MREWKKIFSVAEGYLDLGMPEEAAEELGEEEPIDENLFEFLVVRSSILISQKRWCECEAVARRATFLRTKDPGVWIRWAYATRRCFSLALARDILLEGQKHCPKDPGIHFNLACYACQEGKNAEAEALLRTAISIGKGIREIAKNEPDLAPLWEVVDKRDILGVNLNQ